MTNIKLTINKDDFKKKLNIKDGENGLPGKDGKDAPPVDTSSIALEASKIAVDEIKPLIPIIVPETPEQTVNKVNLSKTKVHKEAVEGLADIERMARENSVPVTTSFYNGKRAKNLNIVDGVATQQGDTVTVDLTTALDARYVNVTGDTMTGALTLANLTNAINSANYPIQMMSGVADGATAVGYSFDTTNYQLTTGATIAKFLTGGNEVMRVSNEGDINSSTNVSVLDFSNNGAGFRFTLPPYAVDLRLPIYSGFSLSDPGSASSLYFIPFAGTIGTAQTQLIFSLNNSATNLYYTDQGGPFIGGETFAFIPDTLSSLGTSVANTSTQKWGSLLQAKDKRHYMGNGGPNPGPGLFRPESSIYFDGSNLNISGRDNSFIATDTFFNSGNVGIVSTTTVGSELLTNGTFTGSAAGWTLGTGWTYSSNTVVRSINATLGTLTQSLSGLTIGEVYVLSFTISASAQDTYGLDESAGVTPSITGMRAFGPRSANGTYTYTFIATATTGTLTFTPLSGSQTALTLDNISLKKSTGGNLSVAGKSYLNSGAILGAGTTTLLPLQFTSGPLNTTALAGGVEFLNDDYYATITTGAKRKTIEFQENYSQSFLLMGA